MHEPEVQFIHVDEPQEPEVTVTTTPETEMFVYNPESSAPVDTLTKAKEHLTRLKLLRRMVKLQRKKAAEAPMMARRVARSRKKNKAAKASRKRNR